MNAPAGKVFAIVILTLARPKPIPLITPPRFKTRADAESAAARMDQRFCPNVVLIDELRAEEATED